MQGKIPSNDKTTALVFTMERSCEPEVAGTMGLVRNASAAYNEVKR